MAGTDRERRFARILLGFLALQIVVALLSIGTAQTYSCGNPGGGHCYGINEWDQQGEFFGTVTTTQIAQLSCNNCNGNFVDDEMWLVDRSTPACVANKYKMCWVETGYVTQSFLNNNNGGQFYFWADARATNSSTFNFHALGATDGPGTFPVYFMIVKDGRVSPEVYQVYIYKNPSASLYTGTSRLSSGPVMTAHAIIIGQELSGSSGAAATRGTFSFTAWATQALDSQYIFWAVNFGAEGNVTNQSPPTGAWAIDPASAGAPPGGVFYTDCCS